MKLSNETLLILKSFASIHPGITISPGSLLYTRTANTYAEATVKETFPKEVRIGNVRSFLRAAKVFADADYDFLEDGVRITEGQKTLTYPQTKGDLHGLLPRPVRIKSGPQESIAFRLSADEWMEVKRVLLSAKKEGHTWQHVTIVSDGSSISIEAGVGPSRWRFAVNAVKTGFECRSVFDVGSWPFVPGPYDVQVTHSYAQFVQVGEFDVRYFVASEPSRSTWGSKRTYDVKVTRSRYASAHVKVVAETPQDAEQLVRAMPVDEMEWPDAEDVGMRYEAQPR